MFQECKTRALVSSAAETTSVRSDSIFICYDMISAETDRAGVSYWAELGLRNTDWAVYTMPALNWNSFAQQGG